MKNERTFFVRVFRMPAADFGLCFFLLMGLFFCAQSAVADDEPERSVCVQWEVDWGWYPAEILEVSGSQARVHYPGYGMEYDHQWIPLTSINTPYSFQISDRVFVQWDRNAAVYWLGTVVGKRSGEYQIRYDGSDSADEWVAECRVFPEPGVGDPVWAEYGVNTYVYAHIVSLGDYKWTVRYKGWDMSRDLVIEWNGDVFSTQVIPCPPAQEANEEAMLASKAPIPAPVGQFAYFYTPSQEPAAPHAPESMKPVGLGPAALGGDKINLVVQLPRFDDLMDFYLAVMIDDASEILLLGQDDNFHLLSEGLTPWKTRKSYWPKTALFQDIPIDSLPPGNISFHFIAAPKDRLDNYYLWSTSISSDRTTGFFTGLAMLSQSDITSFAPLVISNMVSKGDTGWYRQVESFIANERSRFLGSQTDMDPLDIFAWAAMESNNVYPFCWAAFKKLEENSLDPWALNAAAVCLFELDNVDAAGRLLDLARLQDPYLSMTYENAAFYFDQKGDAAKAAAAKMDAANGDLANPYADWDGYHYAVSNGLQQTAASFDSQIPSNFSLLKSNGSMGAGAPKVAVCCSCNGGFYDDIVVCVDECHVTLACFTAICTPRLQCCWQKTPFSLSSKLCYPPTGLQVCISADANNNLSLELGGDLADLLNGYIGVTQDFMGNTTVYLSGGASGTGGAGKVILYTSDPRAKVGAMQYSVSGGPSLARGLGVSAGLSTSDSWSKSPICELNYMGPSQ